MNIERVRFKVPIYNYHIELVLTDDIKAFCLKEELEDLETKPCAALYDHRTQNRELDFTLVFNQSKLADDVIVHECVHVGSRIMRYIGISLIEETEEAYAYLQDYLFRIMQSKLIKLKLDLIDKQNGATNKSKKV